MMRWEKVKNMLKKYVKEIWKSKKKVKNRTKEEYEKGLNVGRGNLSLSGKE